jgi:cytochrome P450
MMLGCFGDCDASWRDGGRLQMVEEMHRLTMNVATRTLFNMVPSEKQEEVGKAMTLLIRGLTDRITSPMGVLKATVSFLPDRKWRECLRILDELIGQIIEEHETGLLAADDLLGR